ncbi:hypothetical protein ABTX77_03550 [Streptomyces sp. NPDC097704]|uniref:hypothetical protein n=1 Tax=Streptomyces sp. NPDC097704 TaxID=3157101 RepID=UPI00331CD7D6
MAENTRGRGDNRSFFARLSGLSSQADRVVFSVSTFEAVRSEPCRLADEGLGQELTGYAHAEVTAGA